jgi:hypothetical protein
MPRPVRVTAIYNKEPEIRLYVLALIGLARQLAEEEREVTHINKTKPEGGRSD